MTLSPGTRLGPYEILGLLGAGGMGDVYRARDTRLDRVVAVKTIRAETIEPDRRSRFEREARAIAALSHPNICTVHDVGHHEGVEFLVMELLEGDTLAARLAKGPLEIADVLAFAIQIAAALDAAHRQGIVHRDLKPGNVMLTRSGAARQGSPQAKLLDFGLAKLRADGALIADAATEAPLTAQGQILGTIPYMAPEQLEGKAIDARTDIFAFGAIVFEMATGKRAFKGSSQASLIGHILHTSPPPITQMMPGAPLALERLVTVCLSKDPEDRWSSAHDVLLQLRSISAVALSDPPVAGPQSRRRESLAWSAAAVAILAALVLAGVALTGGFARNQADDALDVLSVLPPDETTLDRGEAPQISPDGRRVAFVATDRLGRSGLYIRSRESVAARALPDTDNATMPFWSPDSRQLGFFAQGQLKTIAIAGGSPHAIAAAAVPRGGAWSRDDVILFINVPSLPLNRVPAAGGDAVPVVGATGAQFLFPAFLPDGRHYLYLNPRPSASGFVIGVGSLDSTETKELTRSTSSALYAPGYLLFRRDAALVAQPFDARTLQLSGSPVPIVEDAGFNAQTYQGLFSASDKGAIAYQRPAPRSSQLVWFDREGKRLGAAAPPADYNSVCLSGDERRIVYDLADPVSGSIDLWALDVGGDRPSRLTFNPAVDFYPVCSPSGQDVVFASLRDGPPNLYRLLTTAPGSEKVLLNSPVPKIPTNWSRDGRLLVFMALNQKTGPDIEVVPLAGGPPQTAIATATNEHDGRLSPDGRWIAYSSNESGTFDVYVQPFPATGAKWQVSKGGGQQPQWRRDGGELFYIAPDKKLIGVSVKSGSDFSVGEARALVETRISSWERLGGQYAVTADGQRFLVNTTSDTTLPVTLVLNWTAALKKQGR